MRSVTLALLAALASAPVTAVETMVCSYRAYALPGKSEPQEPVVLTIKISSDFALVEYATPMPIERYRVLQNNKYGVVLARSMSTVEVPEQPASIGAFLIAIDRATGKMVTEAVFVGERGEARS